MDPLHDRKPEITYPCVWTYQVVGTCADSIRTLVAGIVGEAEHVLEARRTSRTGKYVSLRLRMTVRDEAHRREVLAALQAAQSVRYVL